MSIFRPATLILACISLQSTELALAANSVEEVVVTSTRLEESIPLDLSRYGNQLEVITTEEISQLGFIDVIQTLQMLVPGLHIRPKNGQFDYFDASLQGSRNQEILWLIDGVRITNRLYNGTSPLDTVPAHMIERIEVLKGGQGIFYGTQSVGGVINIVTKSMQQETDGAISMNTNTNSGYGVNGYYRAGTDKFQYVVYASKDQAKGYQPYRDSDFQPSATDRDRSYDVAMGGLKLGARLNGNSLLSMHYQRTDNELDFARPYLNYKTENSRKEDILTLKYDLQLNDQLGFYIKAYRHNWNTLYTRIYNTLDSNGLVTGALRYINENDYWGYKDSGMNAMTKFTSGHGLEYIVGYDRQVFSGSDDVYRIGDLEEKVNAGFIQVRSTEDLFDNTMLAAGIRYNSPSNTASKTVWNISGKHIFNDRLYVQTNFGTSFLLPDAEQLFVNELYDDNHDGIPDSYFTVGNPALKPETSRNINVSIGGAVGIFSYELTGFRRRISDYIDSYITTYIAGIEGESFFNTGDSVEIDGLEMNTLWQLLPELKAAISYTSTSSKLNGNGKQLTGIPETETKLRLDYESAALPFGANLSLIHVGDLNERREAQRGNYTVVDLSGHYSFGAHKQHQMVVRAENLLDEVYATRVDRGNLDSTGAAYIFDNLGMERTLHASYTYIF